MRLRNELQAPGSWALIAFSVSAAIVTLVNYAGDGGGMTWLIEGAVSGIGDASLPFFALAAALTGSSIREDDRWLGSYLNGLTLRSLMVRQYIVFGCRALVAVAVTFALGLIIRVPRINMLMHKSEPVSGLLVFAHGITTLIMLGGLGVIWLSIGWHAGTRIAAIAVTAGISAVDAGLPHVFADYHQVLLGWAYSPIGATQLVIENVPPILKGDHLSVTTLLIVNITCAALALGTIGVPTLGQRSNWRGASRRSRYWLALGAIAFIVGVAVPEVLANSLPWYQSPAWRIDQHLDRAADDVVTVFLTEYRNGEYAIADRLVSGASADTVLGVFQNNVAEVGAPSQIEIIQDRDTPGAVTAYWASGLSLNFCLTRSTGAWRIKQVTAGPCSGR